MCKFKLQIDPKPMNSYVRDEFRMKIAKIPPKGLGKEEGEEADI